MRISLRDIHKHYGPVRANDGITLTVVPGRIHGILGENGAGKSTLMKILSGLARRTRGQILLDGEPADDTTPARASALGIGMLYQEPLDFPLLSVTDNFRLGQPPGPRGAFRSRLEALCRRFDFSLDPDADVRTLTVGERQQLEILRLLELGVRALILDEPTTGISFTQKTLLFEALRRLAGEGKSILLVSHKLEDVEALCHAVTVLRAGKVAGEMAPPFDPDRLMEMMFGARPEPPVRRPSTPGDPVLEIRGVSALGGRTGLRDGHARVHAGEMVGLAGLEGSGQGVFLRVAAGLRPPLSGEIRLDGRRMDGRDYPDFRDQGVGFLPAARLEEGLVPGLTIDEHMALLRRSDGFWVRWTEARQDAMARIETFRIMGTPEGPVESLSGGNQQRLLLSFLSTAPRLLLLENPTRGLDLESAHWVWNRLQTFCAAGSAVVFSSAELDEILMVADRVLVFFDGSVIRDVRTRDTDARDLGLAIAGRAA